MQFVADGLYLGGKKCLAGLTNFVQSYFKQEDVTYNDCEIFSKIDLIKDDGVCVFPNPFVGETVISFPYVLNNAEIIISDIMGRIVSTISLNGENKVKILRNNFKSGVYIVSVLENDGLTYKTKLFVID